MTNKLKPAEFHAKLETGVIVELVIVNKIIVFAS